MTIRNSLLADNRPRDEPNRDAGRPVSCLAQRHEGSARGDEVPRNILALVGLRSLRELQKRARRRSARCRELAPEDPV